MANATCFFFSQAAELCSEEIDFGPVLEGGSLSDSATAVLLTGLKDELHCCTESALVPLDRDGTPLAAIKQVRALPAAA